MIGMLIGSEDYIATPSTVTAIRPALGYKFLTSKAYASAPALSGLGKDFDTINKHGANCHPARLLSSAFRQLVMAIREVMENVPPNLLPVLP